MGNTGSTRLKQQFGGLDVLVILAIIGQFSIFALYQKTGQIGHDIAWYLVATSKWLDGAVLYRDIVEVNPPANFYWTVPVVALSRWVGLGVHNALLVWIGFLTLVSVFWSWRLISPLSVLSFRQKLILVQMVLVACLWFTIAEPGQREHVFVLCILPFLFGRYAEASQSAAEVRISVPHRICLAVIASLGIIIKPHFVFVPLAVALFECADRRSFKPLFRIDYWVMVAICMGYVVYVAAMHPLYFSEVVPMAMAVYSDGFGSVREFVLLKLPVALFLLPLVFIGRSWWLWRAPQGSSVFLAAALGGGVSYYVQFAGFDYHLFPFMIFGFVGFVSLTLFPVQTRPMQITSLVALVALGVVGANPVPYEPTEKSTQFHAFIKTLPPATSVLSISTYLSVNFPSVTNHKVIWASRFPHQWLLPGAMIGLAKTDCSTATDQCERYTQILTYTRNANIADFDKYAPDYVAFDTEHWNIPDGSFQFLPFMQQDAEFAAKFASYSFVNRFGTIDVWQR